MEKRRLTSLRSVLLQYLVRTALACLLVAVGWLLALMLWIQNGGLFLPANQAAQACQKAAQDVLPGMTAATFDETQLDSLCRYALFAAPDSSEVLATNMDAGHLQRAMENRQGKTHWHFGYTQYYMTSKLQDGTVCLLQFDYAVPYADPALRGVLPDMQTVHCILGILLLVGAVVWSTHRTGRFLTRETEKLTAAAQAVARKELDSAVFSGAKVREYESTLQALQTMGDALTGSLQSDGSAWGNWDENPDPYRAYYWILDQSDAWGGNSLFQSLDIWYRKINYLRVNSIRLGYTFPERISRRLHMASLRLHFEARNPFVIASNYDGYFDPEKRFHSCLSRKSNVKGRDGSYDQPLCS